MQFIASILTKIGASIATAAGAPMSIIPAGVAAGGSTIASILSGGATALSVLYGVQSADESATASELAAGDTESQIADDTIAGLQQRNSLKAALEQSLGDLNTAYAGSGIDLSFGTPVQARKAASADADRALSIDNMTQLSRASQLQEKAQMLRLKARSTRGAGLLTGIVKGVGYGADLAYRG